MFTLGGKEIGIVTVEKIGKKSMAISKKKLKIGLPYILGTPILVIYLKKINYQKIYMHHYNHGSIIYNSQPKSPLMDKD